MYKTVEETKVSYQKQARNQLTDLQGSIFVTIKDYGKHKELIDLYMDVVERLIEERDRDLTRIEKHNDVYRLSSILDKFIVSKYQQLEQVLDVL